MRGPFSTPITPLPGSLFHADPHFTVIAGLTATRLQLFDSYGYRWITLAACATTAEAQAKRHRIHIPSLLVMGP